MNEDGRIARALVLSGSIGYGHDAVAAACSEGLATAGLSVETFDCMTMLGRSGHWVGERVFRAALGITPVYDAFHFSVLRGDSGLVHRIEQSSARHLIPAIEERAAAAERGLLLSVFAGGTGAAGRVSASRPLWRAAVFCTDATAHRMWVHEGIERYFVSSPTAAATVRQYDPFADVVEVPPPIRSEFFDAPTRTAARAALGLDQDRIYVLMMAGGWGLAPLADAAATLAHSGYRVLAVAGRNAALEARLRASAARLRHASGEIVTFGFTDRIPELMAASDVVVTSPGQTWNEARLIGRPAVILDTVPGHGRENMLLSLASGGAVASHPDPEMVERSVTSVLHKGVSATQPWPVSSAAEWQTLFLDAISDLVPAPATA